MLADLKIPKKNIVDEHELSRRFKIRQERAEAAILGKKIEIPRKPLATIVEELKKFEERIELGTISLVDKKH